LLEGWHSRGHSFRFPQYKLLDKNLVKAVFSLTSFGCTWLATRNELIPLSDQLQLAYEAPRKVLLGPVSAPLRRFHLASQQPVSPLGPAGCDRLANRGSPCFWEWQSLSTISLACDLALAQTEAAAVSLYSQCVEMKSAHFASPLIAIDRRTDSDTMIPIHLMLSTSA
jgi:hypothetical protein